MGAGKQQMPLPEVLVCRKRSSDSLISKPCWKTLLENTSAEVLPLKYLNYPKNYPENLFLFIKTNFPLDGFIYQGRAPLPTGFLGYLTFPSIFKEENKKKIYKKREMIAQLWQLSSNKTLSCKTLKCQHSGSSEDGLSTWSGSCWDELILPKSSIPGVCGWAHQEFCVCYFKYDPNRESTQWWLLCWAVGKSSDVMVKRRNLWEMLGSFGILGQGSLPEITDILFSYTKRWKSQN